MKMYNTLVLPTLLYNAETWLVGKKEETRLEKFHYTCVKLIWNCCNTWAGRAAISKANLWKFATTRDLREITDERLVRWLGHVGRSAAPVDAEMRIFLQTEIDSKTPWAKRYAKTQVAKGFSHSQLLTECTDKIQFNEWVINKIKKKSCTVVVRDLKVSATLQVPP